MNGNKDFDITFGIITDGTHGDRINMMIDSIESEKIPNCEVIIIGGNTAFATGPGMTTLHIPFVERKRGWITKKKNLITEYAKYDVIVYTHDYLALGVGWYEGYKRFCAEHSKWDVAMNIIKGVDGSRYRDWVIWDDPDYAGHPQTALPPYTYTKTQFMYVSGAYWVAKKYVMEDLPLNEKLFWGDGEDVEWSKRMLKKYNYVFNPYSETLLLKHKDVISRRCY